MTPIHHTSFINLIESHFNNDQIYIFDIDQNFRKIKIQEEFKKVDFDIIVITHLWGKKLDISEIINYIF